MQRCALTGFHPHELPTPIFAAGAHVQWAAAAPLTVVDLRGAVPASATV